MIIKKRAELSMNSQSMGPTQRNEQESLPLIFYIVFWFITMLLVLSFALALGIGGYVMSSGDVEILKTLKPFLKQAMGGVFLALSLSIGAEVLITTWFFMKTWLRKRRNPA